MVPGLFPPLFFWNKKEIGTCSALSSAQDHSGTHLDVSQPGSQQTAAPALGFPPTTTSWRPRLPRGPGSWCFAPLSITELPREPPLRFKATPGTS